MSTSDVLTVALIVLVPAALLWGVFLARTYAGPARPALGIPRAMRPGQPDEVLEGPRLFRIQTAGFVFTVLLAAFIVGYWLPEAQRQAAFQERFNEESVERGRLIYDSPPPLEEDLDPVAFKEEERAISLGLSCVNCHGPEGSGGFAQPPFRDPVTGEVIAFYQAPPLDNVFQRWDEEVVRFTIERGRPGTPMPAWGVDYGGPATPQMIDDVINYLKTLPGNQQPPAELPAGCDEPSAANELSCGQAIFETRCAVCHGPEGQGKDEAGDSPETAWYQGMALWRGKVLHLDENQHLITIRNGRRFAFMPAFAESPSQGIPAPPYPLTDAQIRAVMAYERSL